MGAGKKKSCENHEEGNTPPLRGGVAEVEEADEWVRSQALFGQRGRHLVSQRGQLRRVGHVDAARGGHSAELLGGIFQ